MQAAAACFTGPLPAKVTKTLVPRRSSRPHKTLISPRAVAITTSETSTLDYSSSISVFPMEACDIIGGEACNAKMFPEAKLAMPSSSTKSEGALEEIDRDYLEYDEPKTVFCGEACDDLGGEFCEAEYQMGVYRDQVLA